MMISLPPLTPAFAAQASAFLDHSARFMQEAFSVQEIGSPHNLATPTALSLAALTNDRERTLGYRFYFEKSEMPTEALRVENAYHVVRRLFSALPETEIPVYEVFLYSLMMFTTGDLAKDVLDCSAAVMVRALQVSRQDKWLDDIAHLPTETYLALSSALFAFELTDEAKAMLVHAPELCLKRGPWSQGLEQIHDRLKRMGLLGT